MGWLEKGLCEGNTRSRVQKNTRSRVHLVCREWAEGVRAMPVEARGSSHGLVGVWRSDANEHEISCAESIRSL